MANIFLRSMSSYSPKSSSQCSKVKAVLVHANQQSKPYFSYWSRLATVCGIGSGLIASYQVVKHQGFKGAFEYFKKEKLGIGLEEVSTIQQLENEISQVKAHTGKIVAQNDKIADQNKFILARQDKMENLWLLLYLRSCRRSRDERSH